MTQPTNWKQSNVIWGVLLVLGGFLFLLQNLGIFQELASLVWVMLFGAGGLFFLYLFLNDRVHTWWAAIPGATLLGLAATVFFGDVGPNVLKPVSGPLFLASIGFGFALVYLAVPTHWWAIIPAGVLTTLGVVAAADKIGFMGFDSGGIFFLGLGITFLVVALIGRDNGQNLRWAYIPAAVLLVMGFLIGTSALAVIGYLWPLALIVGGGLLIWRYVMSERQR
jgi:hypothetical protein